MPSNAIPASRMMIMPNIISYSRKFGSTNVWRKWMNKDLGKKKFDKRTDWSKGY